MSNAKERVVAQPGPEQIPPVQYGVPNFAQTCTPLALTHNPVIAEHEYVSALAECCNVA